MKPLNVLIVSKALVCIEIAFQIVVVITEAVSNSQYRRFTPSWATMSYTGQSLLVIIVAILLILASVLIFRNVDKVLPTSYKVALVCIGASLGSFAFRIVSTGFMIKKATEYYTSSYNITSICIVIGASLWIPFAFCQSYDYLPEPIIFSERQRTRSTNSQQRVFTNRPQTEDNYSNDGTQEQLPSYFEMMRPPSYKNATPEHFDSNGNSSINDVENNRREPSINLNIHNETSLNNNSNPR